METFKNIVDMLGGIIWSLEIPGTGAPWLVCALLGVGLFLTIRMGVIQARKLRHAVRIVKGDFDDPSHAGDISHFQALTTALSATVGIGNIAGVALAIHFGGPGAIFWMWVCAAFGMCTKYVEVSLAMKYRDFDEAGNSSGGPQKYIEKGLGTSWKPLAFFFAFCAICSSLGAGNMNQINTLAQAVNDNWHVPDWLTGVIAAVVVGAVILGGIKRIGRVTSILAPSMAVLYVAGSLIVLAMNAEALPGALGTIVSQAFNPQAGFAGTAAGAWSVTLLWGVKRGLFSNEAGQGSAPIAHAAAKTDTPLREGLVALLEPFIDTIIICTMTALVILTANVWDQPIEETHGLEDKNLEVWTWPTDGESASTPVAFGTAMGRRDGEAAIEKAGYDGPADGDTDDAKPVVEILVIENGRPARIEHDGGGQTRAVLVKHDAPLFFEDDDHVIHHIDGEGNRGAPYNGRLKVKGGSIVKKQHSWIQKGPELETDDGSYVVLVVKANMIKNGQALTAEAFRRSLGDVGLLIVTVTVLLFALSTAISWSYYGDRCTEYLFGLRGVIIYKMVFLVFVFLGAILPLKTVWDAGDVALGMMTIPNLIAVVFLSGQVRRMQDDYFSQEHVPLNKKK